jgi:hypothetical protein
MLQFDFKGYLKPYQPIPCKVSDLKFHFVDEIQSVTRKLNYEKYVKYSHDLRMVVGEGLKQWINGSFVTKKTNPKDIDLVTFLDHEMIKKLGAKLDPFRPINSWNAYGVDAYICEVYPVGHPSYKYTDSDIAYWNHQFGHSRPNRKGVTNVKGFLEIIY